MIPAYLLTLLLSQERAVAGTVLAYGTIKSVDVRAGRLVVEVDRTIDSAGTEANFMKPVRQSVAVGRGSVIRSRKDTSKIGALKDLKSGLAAAISLEGSRIGEATIMRARDIVADIVTSGAGNPRTSPSRGVPRGVPPPASAPAGRRVVDSWGICRDPVMVPMVFPVLGRKAPPDNWLVGRDNNTRPHLGQDIMAPHMTPLVACFDGTVYVRSGGIGGHYRLTVVGDNGWSAEYMHINNDRPGTDDGQGGNENAFAPGILSGRRVVAGQLLGWVGDSGNAEPLRNGWHLHFELWQEGAVFNAWPSLSQAEQLSAPRLALLEPQLKPKPGEIRVDGVVQSYDPSRNVLTIGLVAAQRAGKSTVAATQPAKRYATLESVTFEGDVTDVSGLAPGQDVVVLGLDLGEGKAVRATKVFISGSPRERAVPPPVDEPPPEPRPNVQPPVTEPRPTTTPTPAGRVLDRPETEILTSVKDAVNAYRKRYNAAPLETSRALTHVAMQHARAMLREDFLDSQPRGKAFLDLSKEAGYAGSRVAVFVVGEEEDPFQAVRAWLRDADARDALLSPGNQALGVGFLEDLADSGTVRAKRYWVVVLGGL